MNKLLFILVVTEILAVGVVFGFKMKTTRGEYEKKIRWTVEHFKQLPGEVESLPFSPVANSSWVWKIVLKSDGDLIIMTLKNFDTKFSHHRRDILVNGNVAFRNSTHHLITREYFPNHFMVHDSEALLFQVPTFTWIGTKVTNFNAAINSILILDFDFNITAPYTIFEHPGRH